MDRVIYVEEVLKQLNIKSGFLYKLINSGQIHSFKLGRRRAFMQSDIDAFIRAKSGKEDDNVVHIADLTPSGAMAKGLGEIDWDKYSFDQLCRVWSLIGDLEVSS